MDRFRPIVVNGRNGMNFSVGVLSRGGKRSAIIRIHTPKALCLIILHVTNIHTTNIRIMTTFVRTATWTIVPLTGLVLRKAVTPRELFRDAAPFLPTLIARTLSGDLNEEIGPGKSGTAAGTT